MRERPGNGQAQGRTLPVARQVSPDVEAGGGPLVTFNPVGRRVRLWDGMGSESIYTLL